jgi:hypothetical protein
VVQRLYPVNHRETKQKSSDRNRAQPDQDHINGPVQALPLAAMLAFQKMLLVIPAHFRSNPGNVIPPAGKYVADHSIRACCYLHRLSFIRATP